MLVQQGHFKCTPSVHRFRAKYLQALLLWQFTYAQMPKVSSFLGHWKIGKPWKICYSKKTHLKVMTLEVKEFYSDWLILCDFIVYHLSYLCNARGTKKNSHFWESIAIEALSHFCSVNHTFCFYEVKLRSSHFCWDVPARSAHYIKAHLQAQKEQTCNSIQHRVHYLNEFIKLRPC